MQRVVIIGRQNTGKSTLFNALTGKRKAITSPEPGVTRDYVEEQVDNFMLIDTGGILKRPEDELTYLAGLKSLDLLTEADLLILLCEKAGLTGDDFNIAEIIRKSGKPAILVINKFDELRGTDIAPQLAQFYELGLGDPIPVSAAHSLNISAIIEKIEKTINTGEERERDPADIKTAIIGKQNVGKSSLLNRVTGQERSIVFDHPGTTRDTIDAVFTYKNKSITIVDTAGIRKKKSIADNVEYYSVSRAIRVIRQTQIVILLLDANEGVTDQDKKILSIASESGKGMIIAVNKWDAVKKETGSMSSYTRYIRSMLPSSGFVPVVMISAKTRQRVSKLLDLILEVDYNYKNRIQTNVLNKFLEESRKRYNLEGRVAKLKIYYISQVSSAPPVFTMSVNNAKLVSENFKRYFTGLLRERFGFTGCPVRIKYRAH